MAAAGLEEGEVLFILHRAFDWRGSGSRPSFLPENVQELASGAFQTFVT
jgi:hypothetical protein